MPTTQSICGGTADVGLPLLCWDSKVPKPTCWCAPKSPGMECNGCVDGRRGKKAGLFGFCFFMERDEPDSSTSGGTGGRTFRMGWNRVGWDGTGNGTGKRRHRKRKRSERENGRVPISVVFLVKNGKIFFPKYLTVESCWEPLLLLPLLLSPRSQILIELSTLF